jgi:hypothetical protein
MANPDRVPERCQTEVAIKLNRRKVGTTSVGRRTCTYIGCALPHANLKLF